MKSNNQDPERFQFAGGEDGDGDPNCRLDSLPDALLLTIFNKIADLKNLILCSAACKRFSLLIPQVDTLFVHTESFLHHQHHHRRRWRRRHSFVSLFHVISARLVGAAPWRSLASSVHCSDGVAVAPYGELSRLKCRFPELKSLHVQLRAAQSSKVSGSDGNDSSFTRWKAVFGTRLRTCVILSAASLRRTSDGAVRNITREAMTEADLKSIHETTKCALVNASFRLAYYVPRDHAVLRSVVVSDDGGRGKLYLGEDELSNLRSSSSKKNGGAKTNDEDSAEELRSRRLRSLRGPLRAKVWYAPVLKSAASGWEMERATVVAVRRANEEEEEEEEDDDDDDDAVMEREVKLLTLMGGFGEEDEKGKVWEEAMMEMVKTKKKRKYVLRIPRSLD